MGNPEIDAAELSGPGQRLRASKYVLPRIRRNATVFALQLRTTTRSVGGVPTGLRLISSQPTGPNLGGSVRNAPMTCCCCIQRQAFKPPQTATSALRAVDEIVILITAIGLIAFLTPLPDAIGEVLSGWGILVRGF